MVDLISPRPVWRVPDTSVEAIRRAFGRGWSLAAVKAPTASDGDGGAGSPEAIAAVAGAEVYIGWGIGATIAEAAAGSLRWAHTASAGVGRSLTPAFRATGAVLTNSAGVQAEPMADWVIAAIGYCLRGFHAAEAARVERRWAKDEFTDGRVRPREFQGTRVGLIGLGGVGRAVARRCTALRMVVRGIRRHPVLPRPRGVRWVGGPADLARLAGQSDVLVITAPLTAETRGLVTGDVLDLLPPGAFLINLARGGLVDEAALLDRLDNGRLGGCVLDVTRREPLPADSALWTHPQVFVTPHVSAVSDRFWERETALIVENVGRYLRGRRLRNVVDLEAGY